MDYKIEEIKEFRAIGYKKSFNCKTGENFQKIPLFWQEVSTTGKLAKLMEQLNQPPYGALGICANMRENDFDYYIAVSSEKEAIDALEEINVETQTYAIFSCKIDEIQNITKKIFSTWLPNSEYIHVEGAPDLEIYPDETNCEICIPIRK